MTSRSSRHFSFGENWQKYLDEMPATAIERMTAYVTDWLGSDLRGLRLIDIGSGQGLTSLAAHRAGADVVSMDIDPASVEATRRLWAASERPRNWTITQGSILDPPFVGDLGTFDVVVSWGVLHHTGKLWDAIDTAASMVSPGGRLWIALYHRTTKSGRSLRMKRLYNSLPKSGKWLMRTAYGSQLVAKAVVRDRGLQRLRGYDRERGMSWRRDIADWLGGLPYEVSSPGEVIARLNPAGFTLSRLLDAEGEAGNDVYLFDRRRGDNPR